MKKVTAKEKVSERGGRGKGKRRGKELKTLLRIFSDDVAESDSDSDSRDDSGGRVKRQQSNSPGKRTIASSSGSDVALHEGAELSPDDNTGTVKKKKIMTMIMLTVPSLVFFSSLLQDFFPDFFFSSPDKNYS